MKNVLWLIVFHHKYGESYFPVFQLDAPTDEQMIAEANKDGYDPSDERDQLEFFGPFDVPDQMDRPPRAGEE